MTKKEPQTHLTVNVCCHTQIWIIIRFEILFTNCGEGEIKFPHFCSGRPQPEASQTLNPSLGGGCPATSPTWALQHKPGSGGSSGGSDEPDVAQRSCGDISHWFRNVILMLFFIISNIGDEQNVTQILRVLTAKRFTNTILSQVHLKRSRRSRFKVI